MQYIARWGPKGFLCTPNKVVPFNDFSSSKAAKTELQDSSDSRKTNIKGIELQTMSLSTKYLRAAGVDPRAQLEEWESLVSKKNPLYIGGVRFGPEKMLLKSVDGSDYILDNSGNMLAVTVSLNFEEYDDGKDTDLTIPNEVTGYASAKNAALSAGPSTADKESRKPK